MNAFTATTRRSGEWRLFLMWCTWNRGTRTWQAGTAFPLSWKEAHLWFKCRLFRKFLQTLHRYLSYLHLNTTARSISCFLLCSSFSLIQINFSYFAWYLFLLFSFLCALALTHSFFLLSYPLLQLHYSILILLSFLSKLTVLNSNLF